MKSLLKSKKIRETSFRLEVLSVLLEFNKPLSLEQLESRLIKFDRITLYRTIKTFIDKGLIHEILIQGETKKIALCPHECKEEHKHHLEHIHFFCENCKETFCIDEVEIPKIKVPHHQIHSFEIQAKGVCKKCSII